MSVYFGLVDVHGPQMMDFKVIVWIFSQISMRGSKLNILPSMSASLSGKAAAAGAHRGHNKTMCLILLGVPRHNSEVSAENTRLLYF